MYSFGGEREVSNHDSIKHFVYHSNCHINIVLNKNKKNFWKLYLSTHMSNRLNKKTEGFLDEVNGQYIPLRESMVTCLWPRQASKSKDIGSGLT